MIRWIGKKVVKSITDENYSKDQREKMEYAIITISFELIKMIALIIILSVFGYFKQVMIISGIMVIVKPFIGGYHEARSIL